jgi:hypothetical protein
VWGESGERGGTDERKLLQMKRSILAKCRTTGKTLLR